jgi:MFS family permease
MVIPLAGGVFLARIGATKGSLIIATICAIGTLLVALSVPTGNFHMLLAGRTLYGIIAQTDHLSVS